QVQPTLHSPQIGNVGDPAAIGGGHGKASRQQITLDCHCVSGVGGATQATTLPRAQTGRPHQTRYALASSALAALAQLRVYTRTAIAASALRIDRRHLQRQGLILKGAWRRRPLTPGVVSRARDL